MRLWSSPRQSARYSRRRRPLAFRSAERSALHVEGADLAPQPIALRLTYPHRTDQRCERAAFRDGRGEAPERSIFRDVRQAARLLRRQAIRFRRQPPRLARRSVVGITVSTSAVSLSNRKAADHAQRAHVGSAVRVQQ